MHLSEYALPAAVAALVGATSAPTSEQVTPPCSSTEARQFDFWIGEWDVLNRQRDPRRPTEGALHETGAAVARIHAMLDGCLIVEHWAGHLLPDRHVLGFSARLYDPGKKRWVILLNWPGPRGAAFFLIEGGFDDGVGSFAFEGAGGGVVRYRFRDVTEQSLVWEGSRSDGGDTWDPFWIMEFRRRNPVVDAGLLHEPAVRIGDRCPAERARAFDFLIGEWEGELSEPSGARRPVHVEAWPLLEGCAVMDVVTIGQGASSQKRWRVRSFLEGEGAWVQYSVDRHHPRFVRWEGEESDGGPTLVREDPLTAESEPRGEASRLTRVRWSDTGPDSYVREVETSSDGGQTWSLASRAEMARR